MPRRLIWTPPRTPFRLQHVAPLGVTSEMLERASATGRITRLGHGVYVAAEAVAADPSEQHLQVALARQLRNPHLIASHTTAALAWGLDLVDASHAAASPPTFIAPLGSGIRARTTARARVHSRDLPTQQRTTHPSGLHLTATHRTADGR